MQQGHRLRQRESPAWGPMDVTVTPEYAAAFPAGVFGFLIVRNCPNRPRAAVLGPRQREVEARLRARFPEGAIDADATARAYAPYFRRFGTRYPVVYQAKTVISGQPIASQSALVEAMFTAEVDTLVLTSGHDLRALVGLLRVDVATEGEGYTKINGKPQALKTGDMVVRDGDGVIASVLYGPDSRTRITLETDAALFGAWCPVGLGPDVAVRHLEGLASLIRLEWPEAAIDSPRLCTGRQ